MRREQLISLPHVFKGSWAEIQVRREEAPWQEGESLGSGQHAGRRGSGRRVRRAVWGGGRDGRRCLAFSSAQETPGGVQVVVGPEVSRGSGWHLVKRVLQGELIVVCLSVSGLSWTARPASLCFPFHGRPRTAPGRRWSLR